MLSNLQLKSCVDHYQTPAYLYDANTISEKINLLSDIRNAGAEIYYSIKANPTLEIIKIICDLGLSCEVASYHELGIALKAGCKAGNIIFVGPAKSKRDLIKAVSLGVQYIICESYEEIVLINQISADIGKKTNIIIRLNPDFSMHHSGMRMSGVASQFGIDTSNLDLIVANMLTLLHVTIKGIQVYNATQVMDAEVIVENIDNILNLNTKIIEKYKIDSEIVDLGGGFGVPTFVGDKPLSMKNLKTGVINLLRNYQLKNPEVKFLFEIGRFIVAESGYLLATVLSKKVSKGKTYLITDAGMHCHQGMSVHGSFIQKNYQITHLDKGSEKATHYYEVAGSSCSPSDVIGRNVLLPETVPGDCLVFHKVGAYGATFSPGHFISQGFPQEVMCHGGYLKLIRRREDLDDILRTQLSINKEEKVYAC